MNLTMITLATGLEIIGYCKKWDEKSLEIFMPMIISTYTDAEMPYFGLSPFSHYTRIENFHKRYILAISHDPISPIVNLWHKLVEEDQKQIAALIKQENSTETDEDNIESDSKDTVYDGNAEHNDSDDESNVVSLFNRPKPTIH